MLAALGIVAAIGRAVSVARGGLAYGQILQLLPAELVQESYEFDRWFAAHPALTLLHVIPGGRKERGMPSKVGKALAYAVLLWVVGFVWGSFVFMTPALKNVAPVPYVSKNPAISFPILIIWLVAAHLLAKNYLKAISTGDKAAEGLKLGVMFAVVNVALDLLVLVLLLQAGFGYFISLTVWLGYLMLLLIPWLAGRASHRRAA